MSRLLESRGLSLFIRVVLGLTFAYSSWFKITDPPAFAESMWNYRILPGFLVNPLAIVLPWIELIVALALISGWFRKGAALLACVMLAIFILALGVDLVRGIAVDCGCFSAQSQSRSAAELVTGMKLDLLRDFGLWLLSLQVLFSRAE